MIGCFVGAIIAGPLSIINGRKNSLIISAVLFTLSAWSSGLPSIFPESVTMLVVIQDYSGLEIGITSMNAPMYIAEIAPSNIRGRMVTYYQMTIVIGFFAVFLATYFIGTNLTETENIQLGWRQMFWLLFFVPKSSRWLALKGRSDEALVVLIKFHDDEQASKEIFQIEQSLNAEDTGIKVNYISKMIPGIIVIGSILSILQQFTIINAVLY